MAAESSVSRLDSAGGKQIATVTVTRADGTVVHRQEIVLADPDNQALRAGVSAYGELAVDDDVFNLRRRYQELEAIASADALTSSYSHRAADYVIPTDKRGSTGRGSTR